MHKPHIQKALAQSLKQGVDRPTPYAVRAELQQAKFQLPLFPTTSIGSFPQTNEIRAARKAFKNGVINAEQYEAALAEHVITTIQIQEELGVDVLVHGEAERNDMVEYFAEF